MDRNADAPWAKFDPEAYVDANYRSPLEVDLLIVRLMRDYFGKSFTDGAPRTARGVDVGAGANLYPALSMLPWCEKVLLLEYAQPNVEYLEKQASPAGFDTVWDPFWDQLREHPAYAAVEPRGRFGEIAIAMRLVSHEDVLAALAAQFDYPFVDGFGDGAISPELVCACDPLGDPGLRHRHVVAGLPHRTDDPLVHGAIADEHERGDVHGTS